MNCNERKESISAFLDGELKGKALGDLKEHLEDCSECRSYLNDLKAVSLAVKEILPAQVSENVFKNIMEKIEKEEESSFINFVKKIYCFFENAFASPGFCTAVLIAIFLNTFILIKADTDTGKMIGEPTVIKALYSHSQK